MHNLFWFVDMTIHWRTSIRKPQLLQQKKKEKRDKKNKFLDSIIEEITTEKFLKSNIEPPYIEMLQFIFRMIIDFSLQKPEEKPNWNHLAVRVVSNVVSLTDLPVFEPFTIHNNKQHIIHVLALIKCLNSLRHPNKTVDNSIQDLLQSLEPSYLIQGRNFWKFSVFFLWILKSI